MGQLAFSLTLPSPGGRGEMGAPFDRPFDVAHGLE